MKNDYYLRILRMLSEPLIRLGESRELSFEDLWIYYVLSDDKENIPNTFAGMKQLGANERSMQSKYISVQSGKENKYQCDSYRGETYNLTKLCEN